MIVVEELLRSLAESGGSVLGVWPDGDRFSAHFDKRWSTPELSLDEATAETVFKALETLLGVRKIGLRVHAGEAQIAGLRVSVRVDRAGGYPFAEVTLL